MPYYLGIDLGGTNIAAGVTDERGNIIVKHSERTNAAQGFEKLVADIAQTGITAAEKAGIPLCDIAAVGMGTPSCINPVSGLLVNANNLGWRNVPLVAELEKHFSVAVYVQNDAACAALGEAKNGAASELSDVLMVTLGTGVGGGIVLGGRLWNGCDKDSVDLPMIGLYKIWHDECLKVLYPELFRASEKGDLIAGRLDFLPIGFGCVTSVGGVGHYCVFAKLRAFQREIASLGEDYAQRVETLYAYWLDHDLKTDYCRRTLTDTTIGRFIDVNYPLIATARLSGMMLDYPKLLENGIGGLKELILAKPQNEFYSAAAECLDLFTGCADYLREQTLDELSKVPESNTDECRRLSQMADGLRKIRTKKPETFHDALQLLWLYALLAGVINYGRLDDFLGPYLAADLEGGRITEQEAYNEIRSLWTMIENRRTTVNGRVIVGGKGRCHPREADIFMRIALKVCRDCRYVEPQFTLRIDDETTDETWNAALDAIGAGATYPTLYNDTVNVPAVSYGMRVDEKTAERYVPFGCTEFVLWGQSTGTPNVCINLLKLLTIYMNDGTDPIDGQCKTAGLTLPKMSEITDFSEFVSGYKKLLNYYMDLCADAQYSSYGVMNEHVAFLFTSILVDDCIERGKPLLDGGVRYLGGTCETYGNINTSDSLYAVKKLVFEDKKITLTQLCTALCANFEGYADIRKMCLECDKYGNDLDTADTAANELYAQLTRVGRLR